MGVLETKIDVRRTLIPDRLTKERQRARRRAV